LSKRLNRTLTIPSLHEYGFELVGGRLLPGEDGPAAQFMYQNANGERLTLYMTGGSGKSDGASGEPVDPNAEQPQGRPDEDKTKQDAQQGAAPGESTARLQATSAALVQGDVMKPPIGLERSSM